MSWPESLLAWYEDHRRDLPWRRTSDPYAIWVSEIMLQQTQVATVIPFWNRWMDRFPTIESLANADDQEILASWQGLGYYRRCRLLQMGAQFVANGGIPSSAEEWRLVPGVGPYTAGAIASISQGEAAALVDGNVERVYSRLTSDSSSGPALNKGAWKWAEAHVHPRRPGEWNQALMELGATVCTPTKPLCEQCPVSSGCVAFKTGQTASLPTKVTKPKPVQLKHVVWVPLFEGELGVRQIAMGTWWEGMWEFPRIELTPRNRGSTATGSHVHTSANEEDPQLRAMVGPGWLQYVGDIKHTVTNHRITIEVHLVRCECRSDHLAWHRAVDLAKLPMPSPQRAVLKLASPLAG